MVSLTFSMWIMKVSSATGEYSLQSHLERRLQSTHGPYSSAPFLRDPNLSRGSLVLLLLLWNPLDWRHQRVDNTTRLLVSSLQSHFPSPRAVPMKAIAVDHELDILPANTTWSSGQYLEVLMFGDFIALLHEETACSTTPWA